MSEMAQAQHDAEMIAAMRVRVEHAKASVAFVTEGAAKPTDPETLFTDEARAFCAALRTIDQQATEIERLRLDYEHLQSVNRQLANERDRWQALARSPRGEDG